MATNRISFALALALAACAPLHATQLRPADQYEALCKTWVRDSVSHLILSWGPPSVQMRLADGTTLYQWDTAGTRTVTPTEEAHVDLIQQRAGNWCTTRFIVGADGLIASYRWNGWDYNDGVSYRIGCYTDYQPAPSDVPGRTPAPVPPAAPPLG